jgi:hypothetical protein
MVITKEHASRTIQNVIGAILGLTFSYLLLTAIVGMLFGVKTPQPYYNEKPFATVLNDPHAKTAYKKSVKPGEIQTLLDHHPYAYKYKEGSFDCSDMSKEVARYLETQGYHTSIIGDDTNEHAWVIVWASKNTGWAIESTSVSEFKNNSGEVVGDDWYDFHFVLDKMFDDKIYDLYYPSTNRDGLHVLDWDDPEVDKH